MVLVLSFVSCTPGIHQSKWGNALKIEAHSINLMQRQNRKSTNLTYDIRLSLLPISLLK